MLKDLKTRVSPSTVSLQLTFILCTISFVHLAKKCKKGAGKGWASGWGWGYFGNLTHHCTHVFWLYAILGLGGIIGTQPPCVLQAYCNFKCYTRWITGKPLAMPSSLAKTSFPGTLRMMELTQFMVSL